MTKVKDDYPAVMFLLGDQPMLNAATINILLEKFWAGDKDKATSIAAGIRAGQCAINGGYPNHEAPFGGYKESGNGRELGYAGLHEYCEIKAMQL